MALRKVTMEFYMFSSDIEGIMGATLEQTLTQAATKIRRQEQRAPGCICTAPEADDILYDGLGQRIGKIEVSQPL